MTESKVDEAFLWKNIYDQERVASRIVEIAAKKEEGITFELATYGIVKLVVEPASAIGDNYMSDTYYNTVVLSNGAHYKAFVKVLPSNSLLRAEAVRFNFYNREIGSYYGLHRFLRELCSEKGQSDDDIPLKVPSIYYSNLDPDNVDGDEASSTVLVIEELSSQGFKMIDNRQGCSKEEAMLIMSSLANFHALTHAWLRKHKNADGSYSLPPSTEYVLQPLDSKDLFVSMVLNGVSSLCEVLQHFGYHQSAYWLEDQLKSIDDVFRVRDASECGPLICICHGDCWSNNFLFHYNDAGVANDNRIVDWQILTPENPGRDIYEFLATSTSPEVRKECGSELLDHYVTTFMSALSKLGVSLEDEGIDRQLILSEIKKKMLFGLFMGLALLPIIMDKTMTAKIEELGNDEGAAKSLRDGDRNTDEMFSEAQSTVTLDIILSNKPLCHRVIGLVEEIRAALQ